MSVRLSIARRGAATRVPALLAGAVGVVGIALVIGGWLARAGSAAHASADGAPRGLRPNVAAPAWAAPQAMPLSAVARPAPAPPAAEPAVCGLEKAAASADPHEAVPAPQRAEAEKALEQRLLRHPDPKVQALAVFFTPESDPAERTRRRDRLALAAAASADGSLYAMALAACRPDDSGDAGNACAMLSLAQWARLEPANGVPWLQLAAEARRRGDAGGEAEAMHRAALASRFDARWGSFAELVDRALPPDAPGWQHLFLMVQAVGVQAALTAPEYQEMLEFCRPERLDANRRQTCDALARGLLDRGTTLMDHGMAGALGRRLGWPAERLQALEQERDAYTAVGLRQALSITMDCAGVQRTRAWLLDMSRLGELGAARRAVALGSAARAPL